MKTEVSTMCIDKEIKHTSYQLSPPHGGPLLTSPAFLCSSQPQDRGALSLALDLEQVGCICRETR